MSACQYTVPPSAPPRVGNPDPKISGELDSVTRPIWGGGDPTSVEILSKFSKIVEILFSQKRGFFRNFRDVSTYNTPKITFYCILINKFPENFEKSAQKFSNFEKSAQQFFVAPKTPRKITEHFCGNFWEICY